MPLDEYQELLNEVYGCQLLQHEDFERSGEKTSWTATLA